MRKIYYIPGIFSLVFLPILFITTAPRKKVETVLKFSIVSERPSTPDIITYNASYLLEKAKGKHIITVDLDSNRVLNSRKMLYIEHEAMRINYSRDTNTIIRISLSENTTYGTLVSLVDMMYKDAFTRFSLIGNDFYIFGEPPVTAIPFMANCFLCNDVILVGKQYTSYEKFQMKAKKWLAVFNSNKLLCISFAFLILIPSAFSIYSKARKI